MKLTSITLLLVLAFVSATPPTNTFKYLLRQGECGNAVYNAEKSIDFGTAVPPPANAGTLNVEGSSTSCATFVDTDKSLSYENSNHGIYIDGGSHEKTMHVTGGFPTDFSDLTSFSIETWFRMGESAKDSSGTKNYVLVEFGKKDIDAGGHDCVNGAFRFRLYIQYGAQQASVGFQMRDGGLCPTAITGKINFADAPANEESLLKGHVYHLVANFQKLPVGNSGQAIEITAYVSDKTTGYKSDLISRFVETSAGSTMDMQLGTDYTLLLGTSPQTTVEPSIASFHGTIISAAHYEGTFTEAKVKEHFDQKKIENVDNLPVMPTNQQIVGLEDEDIPLSEAASAYDMDNAHASTVNLDKIFYKVTSLVDPTKGVLKHNNVDVAIGNTFEDLSSLVLSGKELRKDLNQDIGDCLRFKMQACISLQECSNKTPAQSIEVCITPVPDAPTFAETQEFELSTRVGKQVLQIDIAVVDVDLVDPTQATGQAKIVLKKKATAPEYDGKFVDCGNTSVELGFEHTISIANGVGVVCYSANKEVDERNPIEGTNQLGGDTVIVTLIDNENAALETTREIEIKINTSLEACPDGCEGQVEEDVTEGDGRKVALKGNDSQERDVAFFIAELPRHGKIFDADGTEITLTNGQPVRVGDAVASSVGSLDIFYQPNKDYFNSREVTSVIRSIYDLTCDDPPKTNGKECKKENQIIQECDIEDPTIADIGCPDSVGFYISAVDGGAVQAGKSPIVRLPIFVTVVPDEYDPSERLFKDEIEIKGDNSKKFEILSDEPNFIKDLDGDAIAMRLGIKPTTGTISTNGDFDVKFIAGLPCLETGCQEIIVEGVPSAISTFVRTLELTVPSVAISNDDEVRFTFTDPAGAVNPSYEEQVAIKKVSADGVDTKDNAIPYPVIFGGVGAGLFALAVCACCTVKAYGASKSGATGAARLGLFAADKVTEMRTHQPGHALKDYDKSHKKKKKKKHHHHKKKKREEESDDEDDVDTRSTTKEVKIDVNDPIFDWEKHIDRKTGDVYFFNPKTGESRWDPPTLGNR